jgi:hypothetical protein
MNNLKAVVTGCILFPGQGVSKTDIVELDKIQFIEEDLLDDFIDEYMDNVGDSYLVLENEVISSDKRINDTLKELSDKLKEELRSAKEDGIMTSSHMDSISIKMEMLEKCDLLIKRD